MYSVIIVITFTSTLRNFSSNAHIVSTVVLSALYCCIAWGLADGVFYAWEDGYNSKNHRILIEDSRTESKKPIAVSMIRDELDDTILGSIEEKDREKLYDGIVGYLARNRLKKVEKFATLRVLPHYLLGTTVLAVGTGLVVLLPFFILRQDVSLALRLSNILGIVVLFLIGFYRSQDSSTLSRISSGIISGTLGAIIVLITLLLGG